MPSKTEFEIDMESEEIKKLCGRARQIAKQSYSPYSHYRVGAAVLAGERIFVGTNVENSSFPAGVCAERIALGAAIAGGRLNQIKAIAIYGSSEETAFADTLPFPCGICLQWLSDLAPDSAVIVTDGTQRLLYSARELMPVPFKST